jgi:hypothetical protein
LCILLHGRSYLLCILLHGRSYLLCFVSFHMAVQMPVSWRQLCWVRPARLEHGDLTAHACAQQ